MSYYFASLSIAQRKSGPVLFIYLLVWCKKLLFHIFAGVPIMSQDKMQFCKFIAYVSFRETIVYHHTAQVKHFLS